MSYYGSVSGANEYFDSLLHTDASSEAVASDKPKALTEATQLIDALNYRGTKHTVWEIMYDQTTPYAKKLINTPSRDEIIAADQTQELEFPRGQDTTVPGEIVWACYEIAIALIEGFDPEDAVERLSVLRQGYAAVRTTYADDSASTEYLGYGIPTARVWRWLKPRLVDSRIIKLSRAD
jgi:hypothetical protein